MPFSNYGGWNSNLVLCSIDQHRFTPAWYLYENQDSGVLFPYWETPETIVFQCVDQMVDERKKAFRLRFRQAGK